MTHLQTPSLWQPPTLPVTMRTPRVALLIFSLAASFFLIGRALASAAHTTSVNPIGVPASKSKDKDSVWGFMYYNTPFSLFPPNAAISLTDDNSTSFAARPAAFGPKLTAHGLSGQLWVGKGFDEDAFDHEGELGCSDIPGWDGGYIQTSLKRSFRAGLKPQVGTYLRQNGVAKRSANGEQLLDKDNRAAIARSKSEAVAANDGADDSLHDGSDSSSSRHKTTSSSLADIRVLQESAEIEGKVVLLMRGGCGFLDKVMWAQRRGAAAVIVGDNQKGGPLIQMFAHGDEVENVTIPSVFTARTTAQLLSSLTQPGSFVEDILDDYGKAILKVQPGFKLTKHGVAQSGPLDVPIAPPRQKRSASGIAPRAPPQTESGGLFSRFINRRDVPKSAAEVIKKSIAASQVDWVMVDEWDDEKDKIMKDNMDKSKKSSAGLRSDHFIIGTQNLKGSSSSIKPSGESKGEDSTDQITPEDPELEDFLFEMPPGGYAEQEAEEYGYDDNDEDDDESPLMPPDETHEGLWVTITPTSSASPFFDTLLVLVISPLVTLSVVYALLIIRGRIRRRRWRAPKSVVERLPVRTFHTVAASSTPSPRQPSPSTTSPSTPLLQQSPSRPRSHTTTGVVETESPPASSPVPAPRSASRTRAKEHEKGSSGFSAEWKKYMGRQVECVVCLEEYVDGVSRVMSLPCGHEFHADCM